MKPSILFLAGILLLVGCKAKNATGSVAYTGTESLTLPTTPVLSDADKISILRASSKKLGVHWEIFCIPNEDGTVEEYDADAFENGSVDYGASGKKYVEEGVRDWWATSGDTPADAAYNLYVKLQGPPNQIVEHRPQETTKKSGCDYQTVLSSEDKAQKPCKESK